MSAPRPRLRCKGCGYPGDYDLAWPCPECGGVESVPNTSLAVAMGDLARALAERGPEVSFTLSRADDRSTVHGTVKVASPRFLHTYRCAACGHERKSTLNVHTYRLCPACDDAEDLTHSPSCECLATRGGIPMPEPAKAGGAGETTGAGETYSTDAPGVTAGSLRREGASVSSHVVTIPLDCGCGHWADCRCGEPATRAS